MKSNKFSALASVALLFFAGATYAQSNAGVANPAAATRLSSESTIGDLLDNPAAKQILTKHFKVVVESDHLDQTKGMSLRMLQSYAPERISDKELAELDAELAQLPKSEGDKAKN